MFSSNNSQLIITKGALKNILEISATVEIAPGEIVDISSERQQLQQQAEDLGAKGFRVLGVA